METQNNKYKHCKIYRVSDTSSMKFYYGSILQPLSVRMGGHRKGYRKFQSDALSKYVSIYSLFDEFGIDNCKIELVETYPCETNEELRRREGYCIQVNDCVNKNIAGRTRRECKAAWNARHPEQVLEYRKKYNIEHKDKAKEWYENHKELRAQQGKEHREKHKERITALKRDYRIQNQDRIKERRETHQAKYAETNKQYYERNKVRILKDLSESFICPACNATCTKCHKARHERTQTHQRALEQTEPETEQPP